MKLQTISILGVLALICFSFSSKVEPLAERTYHLIYVDNSKATGKLSLSGGMIDLMTKRVDSLKSINNASIAFFLSNNTKPDYTRSFASAKKIINNLYNGYAAVPNSIADKHLLNDRLFNDDLSDISEINISLFVTENYFVSDLIGENAGILLRFLPKQLQSLTKVPESKVNVTVYYPKGSQSIQHEKIKSFQDFPVTAKEFDSNINYQFIAL